MAVQGRSAHRRKAANEGEKTETVVKKSKKQLAKEAEAAKAAAEAAEGAEE